MNALKKNGVLALAVTGLLASGALANSPWGGEGFVVDPSIANMDQRVLTSLFAPTELDKLNSDYATEDAILAEIQEAKARLKDAEELSKRAESWVQLLRKLRRPYREWVFWVKKGVDTADAATSTFNEGVRKGLVEALNHSKIQEQKDQVAASRRAFMRAQVMLQIRAGHIEKQGEGFSNALMTKLSEINHCWNPMTGTSCKEAKRNTERRSTNRSEAEKVADWLSEVGKGLEVITDIEASHQAIDTARDLVASGTNADLASAYSVLFYSNRQFADSPSA